MTHHPYTFGLEEEYFLVRRNARRLPHMPRARFHESRLATLRRGPALRLKVRHGRLREVTVETAEAGALTRQIAERAAHPG